MRKLEEISCSLELSLANKYLKVMMQFLELEIFNEKVEILLPKIKNKRTKVPYLPIKAIGPTQKYFKTEYIYYRNQLVEQISKI